MMKALAYCVSMAAVTGSCLLSTPAQGELEARLAGRFEVVETVRAHASMPGQVGRQVERDWVLRPRCKRGGCETTLRFWTPDGRVKYVLERKKNTVYRGTAEYLGNCYSKKTGAVVAYRGYRVTSALTLRIYSVDRKGRADAFSTVRKLWHFRRPGVSNKCDARDYVRVTGEVD